MRITDTLNGCTIDDVRRNADGSVTLYSDSSRELTLHVWKGIIEAKPPKIVLPNVAELVVVPSERMRLLQAFQGLMIKYAHYDDAGSLIFVCEPARGKKKFEKSHGHREIKLTHNQGLIDELPPVSAIIKLPSLGLFGAQG